MSVQFSLSPHLVNDKEFLSRWEYSTQNFHKLFINNQFVPAAHLRSQSKNQPEKTLRVYNPASGTELCRVTAGRKEDVNLAVGAARKAFLDPKGWSNWSGKERAGFLRKIAKGIQDDAKYLAQLESLDCGKPFRESEGDISDVAYCFNFYADLAENVLDAKQNTPLSVPPDFQSTFSARLQYMPIGVVASIIPWNYPLLMAAWKIAPALAAGNCVILKPSELSPLTALEFARITRDAGLPEGVFNVITGYGPDVGAPLAEHPLVDKVGLTGSVATGQKVMIAAADNLKNISLELGGKSPIIVFDDVQVEEAVEWIMFGVFWTNGQICSSTSRLIIHENIAEKVLNRLVEETKKIFIGDPFDERDPSIGPLISKNQQLKVLAFIRKGVQEGAKLLVGGRDIPNNSGYYVEPTVFVDVKPHMAIWKDEIFGPVLSVMTFKTAEEALELANDTQYGLASAVLSSNQSQVDFMTKNLRTGITWVNCSQPCFIQGPWGGLKKSGIGRDCGEQALWANMEVKQVVEKKKGSDPWGWYIKPSKL